MLSSEDPPASLSIDLTAPDGSSTAPTAPRTASATGSPAGSSTGQPSALLAALADPMFADASGTGAAAGLSRLPDSLGGSKPPSVDGTSGWSSMDGLARPASTTWQPSPSDGILNSSQPFLASATAPTRPASTGPTLSGALSGHQSFDSAFGRGPSVGMPGMGQQPGHVRTNSMGGGVGAPGGLGGLTPAQQQLLQQQLLLQQQQQQQKMGGVQNGYGGAGVSLNGLNGLNGMNGMQGGMQNGLNGQQAANLASLQAAAQAAAIRQQALLRQQQQQQQQHQQQQANNLLLQQAILAQAQAQGGNAALLNAINGQRGGMGMPQQQPQPQLAGLRPGMGAPGAGGAAGINQATLNALLASQLGGNAAAVQQALQAQQAQQQAQQNMGLNAQQQLLMAQLRAGAGAGGLGGAPNGLAGMRAAGMQQQQQQRPNAQLQSEALIAMQRQQAAAAGALGGMGRGPAPMGAGGLGQDQINAMAQLGLLNKPAGAPGVGGAGLNPQQQAALLNALQGGAGRVGLGAQQPQYGQRPPQFMPQQQQQQQQQQAQRTLPPPQLDAAQQSLLAAALAHQQAQQAQQQAQMAGMRPGMGAPAVQARVAAGLGALGAVAPGRDGSAAADPIQTLQDIGRTLAQLGITVEAAVNAGLLGGLSASDVRIVAESHRQDTEARAARMGGLSGQPQQGQQAASAPGSAPFLGPGSVPSGGAASAPNPSSPTGSIGGASVSSAPARPGRAIAGSVPTSIAGGDDDDSDAVDALLAEIEEEGTGGGKKTPIDESAIKAKVEEMAKQFDAGQYGFFGAAGSPAATAADADGAALTALESDGSGPGGLPDNLLADEMAAKLSMEGGKTEGAGGAAAGAPAAAAAASLWGPAPQGDRPDPFGTYLAGLRLGTGF